MNLIEHFPVFFCLFTRQYSHVFVYLQGGFLQALLGKNRQTSSAMQEESIELPQTVDELQLQCLQLREELIEARAAKEHLHESLQSEVTLLREQVISCKIGQNLN